MESEEAERRVRARKELEEREETGKKKRRERNIWRGMEGEDPEERKKVVKRIIRNELGREIRIRGVEERRGEAGR